MDPVDHGRFSSSEATIRALASISARTWFIDGNVIVFSFSFAGVIRSAFATGEEAGRLILVSSSVLFGRFIASVDLG